MLRLCIPTQDCMTVFQVMQCRGLQSPADMPVPEKEAYPVVEQEGWWNVGGA
jgi:hypothetical protein